MAKRRVNRKKIRNRAALYVAWVSSNDSLSGVNHYNVRQGRKK